MGRRSGNFCRRTLVEVNSSMVIVQYMYVKLWDSDGCQDICITFRIVLGIWGITPVKFYILLHFPLRYAHAASIGCVPKPSTAPFQMPKAKARHLRVYYYYLIGICLYLLHNITRTNTAESRNDTKDVIRHPPRLLHTQAKPHQPSYLSSLPTTHPALQA